MRLQISQDVYKRQDYRLFLLDEGNKQMHNASGQHKVLNSYWHQTVFDSCYKIFKPIYQPSLAYNNITL